MEYCQEEKRIDSSFYEPPQYSHSYRLHEIVIIYFPNLWWMTEENCNLINDDTFIGQVIYYKK